MIIFIALAILWTPYLVTRLLRTGAARAARAPRAARPHGVHAEPPSGAEPDTGGHDAPAWDAWDDRQLTRLLTDSAPRTTTE